MRFILLLTIVVSLSVSCKSKKIQSKAVEKETVDVIEKESTPFIEQAKKDLPDSLEVRLQRTACFGRCPIYTLSFYKDGTVIYKGEKWVEKEGLYKGRVSESNLNNIIRKAKEIGFYEMDNQYDSEYVTDLPSTITTLKGESGFKVVANRYEGPELLYELEKLIDEVADSIEWEKIESKEKMNDKQ